MSTRFSASLALCATAVILLLSSCSSGPEAPQPGTPAFYHAAAIETWKSGDYLKTLDNLGNITGSDNEFTEKARPWAIVTAAGIARGYSDLGDAWELGMRINHAKAGDMRRQIGAYRAAANSTIMQLAETWQKFTAVNKQQPVQFVFTWPPVGSQGTPSQLALIQKGNPSGLSQAGLVETAMLQRGVVLAVAQSTGSDDDTAKAQVLFRQATPAIPVADFEMGMAQCMFDLAAVYGPMKLDMPNRRDMLYNFALDAAKRHPGRKDATALADKIQKAMKKKV
jgi:hypothetical protein